MSASFEHRVETTIRQHKMLSPGDRIVLAVSGGPDSTALFHLFLHFRRLWNVEILVAHMNHLLRGADSDEDARFVAGLAESAGIPSVIEASDALAYCRRNRRSVETGAREIRYAFLERVMNDCRADKIATGHTADDQAETLLMRLIRGAGSEGLAGIRPVRENHVIRPLIEASRREVMAYLNRNGLPFRTDASNATADVTRNRIRQELLPLLEKKFNPEIVSTLTNIGDILREESVFLDHETERILEEIPVERGTERLRFPVSAVKDLPVAIQRRLIRRLIEKTGGEAERLTFAHIERTRRLIQTGETGQRLDIPGDIHLERRRGVLFLRKGLATPFCVAIPAPGTGYIVAGRRITALMVDTSGIPEPMPSCCACFDADGIEFPLTARSREPGDRLNVSGMTGTRSIKELFNEWDIPLLERDEILLITDRKNTLWVAGRRRSRVAPVTESTRRALLIRVE